MLLKVFSQNRHEYPIIPLAKITAICHLYQMRNEDKRKTAAQLHFQRNSKGPESAVFVPESAVFPTYNLEVSSFFRNFAKTMEVFLRVWAAAQQSSSELGSAFALHHPCTCKRNTANTGKTASTPTLSSPITLQLPSHRSTVARRPSPSSLYSLQPHITRVL